MQVLTWLQATRPQFFTVIILPIFLGNAIAWYDKKIFSLEYFILSLIAGILCAAAANVLNDYFDHLNQTDILNTDPLTPFAGGSRMIQNGVLTADQTFHYGLVLLSLAVLLGIFLIFERGLPLLWIGLIGVLSVYFYSAPPLLHSFGLGEITIGLNYGILAVAGSYFVQTQTYSATAFFASLPMAGFAAAILYINQFPDFEPDRAVGKRNWVVRLGREQAKTYYNYLILGSFGFLLLGIVLQYLPIWVGVSFVIFPIGLKGIQVLKENYQQKQALIPAIQNTIALHSLMGILLTMIFLFV
jgi:1,4-dihydroxy-2-naphthoate polyprenyltransferase